MRIKDKFETLINSNKNISNKQYRSGRKILFNDLEIDRIMKLSMIPYYNKNQRGSIKFGELLLTDKIRIELSHKLYVYKLVENTEPDDLIRINDKYYSSRLVKFSSLSNSDEVYIDSTKDTDTSMLVKTISKVEEMDKIRLFLSNGVSIYKAFGKVRLHDKVLKLFGDTYKICNISNLRDYEEVIVDNTREHNEIVKEFDCEINDIDYNCRDYQMKKSYKGLALRSDISSKRSGKLGMSGSYTGEIFSICEIEEITPSGIYYDIGVIGDINIGGYLKEYCSPFEIERL